MRRRKVSPVLAPWKYEELMEFLLPPSNADFQIDNENDDASISEEDDIKTVDNENSQPRIASVQVQVKRDTSNFLDCIEERGKRRAEQERRRVELRNHAIDRNRHANNEGLRDLFSSLYHKTTQLPRQLQLRVQREVFEAVTKAEEEALAYEFPGPSSVEERRVALETEVAEIIVKEEKDDTILIS